ncbi:ABC transporter substrate-binding protein [Paenibacillus sp. UMB4589-SE434]|uniref:ABC transporter substrate-binding protein n=1 Tax=Paenibacillus sp. UMB4589-SE434 TaxID=3046314 RepID=UPI00254F0775|nr:ABC transporter substrate-binding protein [Paenibacillus sp. UMB4589-SE434]MDK8181099.1 ABC transporter substrate-binding protein [Paenibacillus sp. UMB4589-SE434]
MLIGIIVMLSMIGCSAHSATTKESPLSTGNLSADNPVSTTDKDLFMSFHDSTGQQVSLPHKPARIVILNTEVLELFYQLGGKTVGHTTAPGTSVPEQAQSSTDVGPINQVSIEKITSLEPDLVIGHPIFHTSLKEALTTTNTPLALIKMDSYEDILQTAKLLGHMLEKQQETELALQDTKQRIQAITNKLPNQSPKFALITIMSMGVSLQKSGSIALDIANQLKLTNVAAGMQAGAMPSAVPYSIEKLIEADPDYLFVIAYGTEEYGKAKLKEDLGNNPAWASLRAVKENKLFILPADFVNSPGLKIDQTLMRLAILIYPEIYGN